MPNLKHPEHLDLGLAAEIVKKQANYYQGHWGEEIKDTVASSLASSTLFTEATKQRVLISHLKQKLWNPLSMCTALFLFRDPEPQGLVPFAGMARCQAIWWK